MNDENHQIWSKSHWQRLRSAHQKRIQQRLGGYLENRKRGVKEPVFDFLFEYYRFRPGRLARWSPGTGVLLEQASATSDFAGMRGCVQRPHGTIIDPATLSPSRQSSFRWIRKLLAATASRPAFHGCFGLHEWAMVYRSQEIRHQQVPLRMSAEKLAIFVESRSIICSHYDAFRFFSPSAKPLNHHQPGPEDALVLEQPGCLHANMDLYRWAFKGYPWIPSELIADAFDLACDARVIDMRASPYDLSAQGYTPITIETVDGRAEYQHEQRRLAMRAQPLRKALTEAYDRILDALP